MGASEKAESALRGGKSVRTCARAPGVGVLTEVTVVQRLRRVCCCRVLRE